MKLIKITLIVWFISSLAGLTLSLMGQNWNTAPLWFQIVIATLILYVNELEIKR